MLLGKSYNIGSTGSCLLRMKCSASIAAVVPIDDQRRCVA
jgi:hypothetical protein